MRKAWLLVLGIHCFLFGYAQQFGGNPPSLKWRQINTDSARIIFPEGMDSSAQRVASIVHYLAANALPGKESVALGSQLRKINIVLQNQSVIANAYVGLGPFRSEFLLTPELNNFEEGSIPWADQLAVHEYRHVMQFNNFHQGLSQLMASLFGQQGFELAINAAIPNWFYEGDAVYNETIFTSQGRGRLPSFLDAYPSLWEAGKHFSWMKLRNGSLKDYVPNHYYLGFLLVNYGREKYGPDFWSLVTKDASAYKGLFYPFQKAVERYAGIDYKTFRNDAFAYYKKQLKNPMNAPDIQTITPLNKKFLTQYYFPYILGGDSLLYLKASYRRRPAFMIRNGKEEKKVKVRDISIDQQFGYRNGKIVYAAYESDPRWGWRDYSVIRTVDIHTGEQQTITRKTKYFTPDISESGSRIAVVYVGENGKSELRIIDGQDGHVLKSLRSGEISLFTDPKFLNDSTLITAVRLKDGQMALAMADVSGGNIVRLTPPSFNVLGNPCVNNGLVFYTASYQGSDDIFVLHLNNKKIYRVVHGTTGNYFINVANGKMAWSNFTADGYRVQEKTDKETALKEMNSREIGLLEDKFTLDTSSVLTDILSKVTSRDFPVNKYKKSTGLLNFHSWRPYYSDPIFTFSVYGENILNTLQTELYYLYNQNEKTNAIGASAVYGGWFPYINIGTEYTFDRETEVGSRIRHWDQLDTRIGLSIPLSFASGKTFKNFNLGTYYVLRNEFNKGFYKDSLGNTRFSYLQHFLSWSQSIQQATQHIFPHLGYSISMAYRYAVTKYTGNQFIGTASIYLPGILANHSLVLNGAFQQRDTLGQVVFSDQFPYSRGYEGKYFTRMWKISGNYHFPLLYPDWGFGNILYLQQVRANLFYDFTKVYSRDKLMTRNQRSYGGEVFIDTKWWNQYPLTFGFRVSHLLDTDQFDGFQGTLFEFIVPVSIIPR